MSEASDWKLCREALVGLPSMAVLAELRRRGALLPGDTATAAMVASAMSATRDSMVGRCPGGRLSENDAEAMSYQVAAAAINAVLRAMKS